jgi:hypothetical protein
MDGFFHPSFPLYDQFVDHRFGNEQKQYQNAN